MITAQQFAAYIDAVVEQQARLHGTAASDDPWTGRLARLFRFDPHRKLEPNLEIIASYLRPDDVLVDVGGGAGRVTLPLALRCREAIVVDPSAGMGAEFDECRDEAGIANARRIEAGWMDAAGVTGDVVFSADVTYFVRDIVPFIEKLQGAARRRVMIALWSVSPPNSETALYELLYGEAMAPVPGFRELMSVLWEMEILPDLLVLPESPWWEGSVLRTREEAVEDAIESGWVMERDIPAAREMLFRHFDELFSADDAGFHPRWRQPSREVLITWETASQGYLERP